MSNKTKTFNKTEISLKAAVIVLKRIRSVKSVKGYSQKELRYLQRELTKTQAEVAFYLDIRNEQGRGGK